MGNSHSVPRVNNPPELVVVDMGPGIAGESINELLRAYENTSVPKADSTVESSTAGGDSNMLKMMQRMETENQQYIDSALDGSSDGN